MTSLLKKPTIPFFEKPSWRLPVVVMVTAFFAYLPTLPPRASLGSIELMGRVCGWDWRPFLEQPLLCLFLLPFHLLPLAWRPLAVDVGNVLLAALVLGLLVRAVQLWPRDRTPDLRSWQPERLGPLSAARLTWCGPLVAAVMLGLTLNFWRLATAATGDMITLLVVAWSVCCLLEFWHERQFREIWRLALVYGLGMANDWVLIGLLPFLLFAIASLLGWRLLLEQLAHTLEPLFNRKKSAFQKTLANARKPDWRPVWLLVFGLEGGLLLILLLPLVCWLWGDLNLTFLQCLKPVLKWYKVGLSTEWGMVTGDARGVSLALSSLLPLFLISLRWQDESASYYTLSYKLTTHMYWIIHLLVGILCTWVLLGATIGPASLFPDQPFLPHYFICALSLGYCVNLLLRRLLGQPLPIAINQWTVGAQVVRAGLLGLLAVLLVTGFVIQVARNGPVIRLVNRTLPADFERWVLGGLPSGPKVLLAEDPRLVTLARLLLLDRPDAAQTIFLDTSAMNLVDYHRHQAAVYPPRWRTSFEHAGSRERMKPALQDRMLQELAATRPVFALQPDTLYSFDDFQMADQGFRFALQPWPTNSPAARSQPPDAILNATALAEFERELLPQLTNAVDDYLFATKKLTGGKFDRAIELPPPHDYAAVYFARFYARALDAAGVTVQRAGRWNEANDLFTNARNLDAFNLSARLNQDYCQSRLTGLAQTNVNLDTDQLDLGNFRTTPEAVKAGGPIDVPAYLMSLGNSCSQAGLVFQSMEAYKRVLALDPASWEARLWVAGLQVKAGQAADALEMVGQIRRQLTTNGWLPQFSRNLDQLEAQSDLLLHKNPEALVLLERAITSGNGDSRLITETVQTLWRTGLRAETLVLLDRLVHDYPDHADVLALRGTVRVQLARLEPAEQDFSRALELDPANDIYRYRHGSLLVQLRRYDAARQEFQTMLKHSTDSFPAHYGLAQIALAQTNSPVARQELQTYLHMAETNSPDYAAAVAQLKQLH